MSGSIQEGRRIWACMCGDRPERTSYRAVRCCAVPCCAMPCRMLRCNVASARREVMWRDVA
eukprot:985371-Alexandrium_andersonii.AAC.1